VTSGYGGLPMVFVALQRTVRRVRDAIFPRAGGAFGTEQVLQDEAMAIHGADLAKLTGKELNRELNKLNSAALCLSGGGTRYAVIDGRDMTVEAIRPRVKGETTFVDGLIAFAVDTANQCLVPQGITKTYWDKLSGAERFYLKMLDMEARGVKTLDNYQNFARAFKVHNFQALMASRNANAARLKDALEFGRTEMNDSSELHQSVRRCE
jgi:putative DNA methylase